MECKNAFYFFKIIVKVIKKGVNILVNILNKKMIDIVKAENAFKKYLENYNMNDGRVKLKIVHTYGVVEISEYLAKKLNLSKEDTELAKLIALLHDIGRFEQSKAGNGTLDIADEKLFDHAEYGVKVLFEDNLIRNFLEDSSYDNIIYKAILNHNKIQIEDGLTEKELLHTKIVRDADKIDNFRVKQTESFKVLFGTDDIDYISSQNITEKIYKDFMNEKLINIRENKTCLDRWSGYIAFIFDMNFDASLKYLKEHDAVNKCFDRIKYTNPDTIEKIKKMRLLANNYIDKRLEK